MLLETPEDYALATRHLIEQLAAENVRYAEITLSAGVVLWKKQSVSEIFEAMLTAAEEAQTRNGVRVRWIFDAIRHFGADHAREVLSWAKIFRDEGVVAFGIGGDEIRGPAPLFRDVYAEAKDLGLHRTAHAGETGGPESVRQAVEMLGAERIGHGLRAAENEGVIALLRERQVALEVCPTSNAATGLLPSVSHHPLRKFLKTGLLVTINSDDPAMFGCTLEQELMLCAATFVLSQAEIIGLCMNAVHASFMPEDQKTALIAELQLNSPNP
jgi:aminodeoxyfutalosine deaminase